MISSDIGNLHLSARKLQLPNANFFTHNESWVVARKLADAAVIEFSSRHYAGSCLCFGLSL